MALPPLSTILNNAPLIIQGASSLLKFLKEKSNPDQNPMPDVENPDSLKQELGNLHQRLNNAEQSNIQQIELIEALAKQNEALASSLHKRIKHLNFLACLCGICLVIAIVALMFALNA